MVVSIFYAVPSFPSQNQQIEGLNSESAAPGVQPKACSPTRLGFRVWGQVLGFQVCRAKEG